MDKLENMKALIQKQNEEIKQKNEYIEQLEKRLEFESKFESGDWMHAENFYNEINEARKIKEKYDKAYEEILDLKAQYLGLISEMIDEL